jgi:hypothetical protein
VKSSPSPPEAAYIVSLIYDFQPSGATFDPPSTVTCSYDPGHLPDDVNEKDLVVASYDSSINKWVTLDSVVDTEANLITAKVSHFSPVAVFAYSLIIPPAIFECSALNISPSEVDTGEAVTISVLLANTGGELGSYVVSLKINGKIEATRDVTLAAGTSKPISFTTIKNTPGTYSVAVSGLIDTFIVKEKPVPATSPSAETPINYLVLWGVVGGVVIVASVILFLAKSGSSHRHREAANQDDIKSASTS